VTKRNRRMSRLPLMIVLLINTAVTGTGWAMNAPATTATEKPVAEHSHCGEAMEQMEQMADMATVPDTHASQQQHSTGGCCTAGACHCAPPTPASEMTVDPARAPLVRMASISPHAQGAFPAPDLTRLLRPPID
jgi:hypothetical protein